MLKLIPGQIIALLLAPLFMVSPAAGATAGPTQAHGVPVPSATSRPGAVIPVGVAKPDTAKKPAKKAVVLPEPAVASKPAANQNSAKALPPKAESPSPGKKRRRPASPKRCEPQSLTYARQRSGIMSSRNGRENGPMTWFAAEKKNGRTTDEPTAGSVLILRGQGHGMPTGHVAYVEEVFPEGPTTYRVVFSHTNYDRQCHLETNIEAFYDRAAMTLEVRSGAWRSWGRGLKVAGFICEN